ncbi:hypothetical protein Tco_0691634, partial [Tanacetum coccineum]
MALKNYNPDLIAAGEKRMIQLHELDELRHQAYENSRLYKARAKVWHDRKLRMRKEIKHGNKYLKTFDPEVTYTTSIMKTKVARYEIKGIEDMVSKFSKQNIYSTKEILGVKSVSVKKLHGYGHLEEIVVKRSDQQFYKFKEGDFVDLHQNDIE